MVLNLEGQSLLVRLSYYFVDLVTDDQLFLGPLLK